MRPRRFNEYRIEGDIAYLRLTNRQGMQVGEAIVDTNVLRELEVEGRRWCLAGNGRKNVYVGTNVNGRIVRLHRRLLGDDYECIDHINGNGLDNRQANLRGCTNAENQHNRGAQCNNSTGYKGVTRSKKTPRFPVYIYNQGKNHYLGTFACEEEAARAYDQKARELFGEFAYLNFPA